MRPLRLEIEGFGVFREACTVDFTDIELVALVGATGSGKSTIIDAITFALYGSVARYADNRAVAPVINQMSTRARVRLDFEIGDRHYTAVRLVQRTARGATTREARLERGDEVLASDARTMSTEVARLLGLDVDQFNRTVVLPQGRFADFLHDDPADRQATLRQLLGFEIYRQIAGAARQRAGGLKIRIETLQPELDAGDAELTDDRRSTLITHRDGVAEARAAFIEAIDRIGPMATEIAALDRRVTDVGGHRALLTSVREPDGLTELDERLAAADAEVARTDAALSTARRRRRSADVAVAEGPDLTACTTQLREHDDAAAAAAEHAATAAQHVAAAERHAVAQRVADEVTSTQETLDGRVGVLRAVEAEARRVVDTGPNSTRIEHWIELRSRQATFLTEVAVADAHAAAARARVAPAEHGAAAASAAEANARIACDELRERAGVAGYAAMLQVGAPCPLCLHDVAELPEHHIDEDLQRAATGLVVVTDAHVTAVEKLRQAQRSEDEASADADAKRRALATLEADLDGVPDDDTLVEQRSIATRLRQASDQASADLAAADAAAAAHRADPQLIERRRAAEDATVDLTRLRVLEQSQRARRDALLTAVAGNPPEADLRIAIDEGERLAAERQAAVGEQSAAEEAHERAIGTRDRSAAELGRASSALHAVRDRLSVLRPPPLGGERLGADWLALTVWAAARHDELTTTSAALTGERKALTVERDRIESAARDRCAAVLGTGDGDLAALRDRLSQAEASATAAVAAFDSRRIQMEALRTRIAGLAADAAVADQLGHLLRADGFEAWLMQAALDELVDDATVRLLELSSGQFSLELVDREFMVRDHANADELRSARTLSGGETFLASLSLALALADATTELSSDGSPMIESIFLDEGFGTLDPGTLDVVAAAIEELGSSGRMVAIVTHIRELAERMPVQLEVNKVGPSSTVVRVEH